MQAWWCPCADSNCDRAVLEAAASTCWATRTNWCSTTDSNRHRADPKSAASTNWASGAYWCPQQGLSLRASAYKTAALHLSYAGLKFTNGRDYPGQKENLRCLKPPFAAPPKETSTGSAGHLMSLQGRPS